MHDGLPGFGHGPLMGVLDSSLGELVSQLGRFRDRELFCEADSKCRCESATRAVCLKDVSPRGHESFLFFAVNEKVPKGGSVSEVATFEVASRLEASREFIRSF